MVDVEPPHLHGLPRPPYQDGLENHGEDDEADRLEGEPAYGRLFDLGERSRELSPGHLRTVKAAPLDSETARQEHQVTRPVPDGAEHVPEGVRNE